MSTVVSIKKVEEHVLKTKKAFEISVCSENCKKSMLRISECSENNACCVLKISAHVENCNACSKQC